MMNEVGIAFAKLSGISKSLSALIRAANEECVLNPARNPIYNPSVVGRYFSDAENNLKKLRQNLPDLYGDFQEIEAEPNVEMLSRDGSISETKHYSKAQLERLVRDIDQLFEIRANSELIQPASANESRVFISHGRSTDWMKVQAYIDKDIGLQTIELAQAFNGGMTIIEKLEANSRRCNSAVIVMTGEDCLNEVDIRVRENVMHEIGFFHGAYGRKAVILLHEEGVSIPSNLAGIVYIPFPSGTIEASFYVLHRELKYLYSL